MGSEAWIICVLIVSVMSLFAFDIWLQFQVVMAKIATSCGGIK